MRSKYTLFLSALLGTNLHCAAIAQQSPPPKLEEIIETRTIDGLLLSPDRKRIAYRVTTPSAARNTTTLQWFVVAVDGKSPPLPLGQPQEPIWLPLYDAVDQPQAAWADQESLITRGLSPKGIELLRLGPGGAVEAVSKDDADIVSFTLEQDGVLRYRTRNSRAAIDEAQSREELRGVRLDRTLDTDGLRLTRNFKIGQRTTSIRRLDASQGVEAYAGELRSAQIHVVPPPRAAEIAPQLTGASLKVGENVVGLTRFGIVRIFASEARPGEDAYRSYRIEAVDRSGKVRLCTASFCRGLTADMKNIWLDRETGEVVVFHEPNFSARTTVYGWNPATGASRTVKVVKGVLDGGASFGDYGCPIAGHFAFCVDAGPTSPPRLVRINLRSGSQSTLADPNPSLRARSFPTARFMEWRGTDGRISTGVLMLPQDGGSKLPLVITTYRCRGFLRGGSGWMVAEHLVVQRGMASLCVNTNNAAITERDAAGRRLVLGPHKAAISAYAAIIDQLATTGLIDRSRVGIAGHSFSSMVTAYALSHTDLFAAAVSVGNTIDPMHYYITSPTADSFRKYVKPTMGLPFPDDDPEGILQQVSPARNAGRIRAALLMQTVEAEHLSALELFTRMQDTGGTVDMYIFPDEGHLGGREPAHIYWRNRRAADWFSFWLTGKEWPEPAAPDQYALWEDMRRKRDRGGSQ